MRSVILSILCTLTTTALTTLSWAQEKELSAEREIYTPRYPDRLCPSGHPATWETMEHYLKGSRALEMQQRYGKAMPYSTAQIEVLDDVEDEAACRHFNELFDWPINTQGRVFDGGEAEYWYDVTFYKGGDFYFVVTTGGVQVHENPMKPGEKVMSWREWGGDPIQVYHQQNLEHIPHPK